MKTHWLLAFYSFFSGWILDYGWGVNLSWSHAFSLDSDPCCASRLQLDFYLTRVLVLIFNLNSILDIKIALITYALSSFLLRNADVQFWPWNLICGEHCWEVSHRILWLFVGNFSWKFLPLGCHGISGNIPFYPPSNSLKITSLVIKNSYFL